MKYKRSIIPVLLAFFLAALFPLLHCHAAGIQGEAVGFMHSSSHDCTCCSFETDHRDSHHIHYLTEEEPFQTSHVGFGKVLFSVAVVGKSYDDTPLVPFDIISPVRLCAKTQDGYSSGHSGRSPPVV